MEDKELLELAANAAGLHVKVASNSGMGLKVHGNCNWWNPLTDDGDALRLAVAIKMDISANNDFAQVCCVIGHKCIYEEIECNGDALAATRLAITRAAAQIGKEME